MDISGLLTDLYSRVPPLVVHAVDGLTADELTWSPGEGANSIGWLAWHLARVEDHHIAELMGADQLWATGAWAAGFGLEPNPRNTGFGHRPEDVRTVQPQGPDAILDYLAAVHERTLGFLAAASETSLDQIVDRRWDPPVTLGVRLVSIADDCLQHAGQAAYVRGLLTH